MRITATLYDEQVKAVQRLTAEGMNRAEAVRTIVDEYASAAAERDRLQARVDELQAQLRAVNKKNDANDELANTADRQMSAIERMLMEQQRRRSAGLVTRVKWWLIGDADTRAELDDELGE
jgi:U3 small nucleolar ribonucleoprotein component